MTAPEDLPALRLSFELACTAEHAFRTFTERIALWWPASHTMTGEDQADVLIEPGAGGRIYERTRTGREVDWGRVVHWEPPRFFGFRWLLGGDASQATDVELTFVDTGERASRVDLVHTGFGRLGAEGPARRERNTAGWRSVFGRLAEHVAADGGSSDRSE